MQREGITRKTNQKLQKAYLRCIVPNQEETGTKGPSSPLLHGWGFYS